MSSKELRGASRRQFMKGAVALGAAMGWGPSRILDFIARGAGDAAAAECGSKRVQRLVVFVGSQGTQGYMTLLFPQPDSYFDGRMSENLAAHFMQPTSATGATPGVFNGALMNATNYASPPAMPNRGMGAWAAGERFKRLYGVDNMAFRGYMSTDARSNGLDKTAWGTANGAIPSNVGGDKTKNFLVVNRETPWVEKYGPNKAITGMFGGTINPFHINGAHNRFIHFNNGWTLYAAAAAVQQAIPTITPAIMVGDMSTNLTNNAGQFGAAPGAPAPAFVSNSTGMVDLFNSNAARAGGVLSNPKNAVVFEAFTKGMIGSSKTAQVPAFAQGLSANKTGANLVGLNLSEKLAATDADRVRYGFTGNTPAKLAEMRDRMIVTAKALKLGLTAQVAMTYFGDDPHGSFTSDGTGGVNAACGAAAIGNFLNAFMDDLMSVDDPLCPGLKLGDNTVVAFLADTPRTQINRSNWNDPTTGGQNLAMVMSNGRLKTGFFGGDRARFAGEGGTSNDHTARGPGEGGLYDLNTGDLIPFSATGAIGSIMVNGVATDLRIPYGETAMAAILYAVAGDMDKVNQFYRGQPFPAIYRPIII